jgi:uncharacterized protein (TIGR00299 family) protein
MSGRRFAIIDPAAGISGDMLLGALLASGAPREWLEGLPARLGLTDVSVRIEDVERCSVHSVKVTVCLPDGASEGPGKPHQPHDHGHHDHGHGHTHHHEHPHSHESDPSHVTRLTSHDHHGHRHVGELIGMIERAPLSPWVRERAVKAFTLLGEAEGRVHGLATADVPLHEVGAWDALVDIVGSIEGFEQLGITEIFARPVVTGDGWVRAAHGQLPVPAPATAILLEGLPVAPNGPVRGEATTPTGAALLRVLSGGNPPPHWRATRSGWGAGTRNPREYPNALRLILAEGVPEAARVSIITADLDDLSPEYLEPLREALSDAGAVDVQLWPTMAKKGRVGFRLEAVTPEGTEPAVAEACFRHSTTAGVRWTAAERLTLPRHERAVRVDGHSVRVKVIDTPAGPRVKPEYEDVSRTARATGRPAIEVAALARAAAERLEADEAERLDPVHKEQ